MLDILRKHASISLVYGSIEAGIYVNASLYIEELSTNLKNH
jgi:hypothetical protein